MLPSLKISRAVTNLAFNQPFFGSCLMNLKSIERADIGTLATNGKEVFWNGEFVGTLQEAEVRFGLAHEVMHVILKHCQNFAGKDPQLCNVSMDYVINPQLVDAGFTKIEGCLYDETGQFHNLAWEEVYRILEAVQEDQDELPNGVDLNDKERAKIKQDIAGAESHVEASEGKTANQKQEESDNIDDMIIRAATQAEMSTKGSVPKAVKEAITVIRTNQIRWEEQLDRLVKSRYPEDFTFARPNRRHFGRGLYLPTMSGTRAGIIVIAVDTSGSVSKAELEAFVAEVNNIISDCKPEKVYLMSADSAVANVQVYDNDHYFESFDCIGGGGTSFKPVFEYIEENDIEVDQLIYFSDMGVYHSDFPRNHPTYPVIWCSSREEYDVPFGDLIKIAV